MGRQEGMRCFDARRLSALDLAFREPSVHHVQYPLGQNSLTWFPSCARFALA